MDGQTGLLLEWQHYTRKYGVIVLKTYFSTQTSKSANLHPSLNTN